LTAMEYLTILASGIPGHQIMAIKGYSRRSFEKFKFDTSDSGPHQFI